MDQRIAGRMHRRIQTHVEEVVKRAADLSGVDIATFTRSAAYKVALEEVAAREFTVLLSLDGNALLSAMESPPERELTLQVRFDRGGCDIPHGVET